MGYQYLHPDMHPISRPDSLGRADYDGVSSEVWAEMRDTARLENYAAAPLAFAVAIRAARYVGRPKLAEMLDRARDTLSDDPEEARCAAEDLDRYAADAATEAMDGEGPF